MTTPTQHEHDLAHLAHLAHLATGGYTGRWHDHGQPAPWPDDFFDPDTDWRPATNPPDLAPGEQPF